MQREARAARALPQQGVQTEGRSVVRKHRNKLKGEKMIENVVIKIPEKHPDVIAFRAEQAKRQELMNNLGSKNTELAAAQQRYIERKQSLQRSRMQEEAEQLLAGVNARPIGEDVMVIERLQHDVEVIALALETQKPTLDVLQGRFDCAVCEANSLIYVRIERRIYRAVQEAAEAGEEEFRFFRALEDAGVHAPSLRPMRLNQIGLASDSQSRAAFHACEVREHCAEAAA